MFNRTNILLFYREKYVFHLFNLSILIILLSFGWIIAQYYAVSGSIPIHYNLFFGIDRVGTRLHLLAYPSAALLVLLMNFFLGFYIFSRDKYLSYYLILVSALCAAINLVYLIVLNVYIS